MAAAWGADSLTSEPGAASWRSNAWLALVGVALLCVSLVPGEDGFVSGLRDTYLRRLPQFEPRFGERALAEARALRVILAGAGCAALSAWAWASARRRDALVWLLGGARPGRSWRGVALLVVLASSGVLLAARAVRDVMRAQALAGLSFEEARVRLNAQRPLEPDYAVLRAFREGRGRGSGNLLVLRSGSMPGRFDEVFLAAYLFPVRVYLLPADARPDARWLAERRIGWLLTGHERDGAFRPVPLAEAGWP